MRPVRLFDHRGRELESSQMGFVPSRPSPGSSHEPNAKAVRLEDAVSTEQTAEVFLLEEMRDG